MIKRIIGILSLVAALGIIALAMLNRDNYRSLLFDKSESEQQAPTPPSVDNSIEAEANVNDKGAETTPDKAKKSVKSNSTETTPNEAKKSAEDKGTKTKSVAN